MAQPGDHDLPCSFERATAEHVIQMIVVHHLVGCIAGIRCIRGFTFRGTIGAGVHTYNDEQLSSFVVGWNEHGVVGLARHHYASQEEVRMEPADRKPMRWLAGVPETLMPLAVELSNVGERHFNSGFWLTRGGRRHRAGAGGDDGSAHFDALCSSPPSALFDPPSQWVEMNTITRVQGELARTLARRAMAGGGDISAEETAILLEPSPAAEDGQGLCALDEEKARGALDGFAQVGLRWALPSEAIAAARASKHERVERAIAARMTPDERALFDAAHTNDVATVRALLASGVATEMGSVLDQFDDMPGLTPLLVAIRAGSMDAALALLEGGADTGGPERLTPLECAFGRKDLAVVRACLARGASPNAGRPSLLLRAAESGDVPMTRLLLDAGAVLQPEEEELLADKQFGAEAAAVIDRARQQPR